LVIRVVQHALTVVVVGERDRVVLGVVAGVSSSMSAPVESLMVGEVDLVVEMEEDIEGGYVPDGKVRV
jgi:hypothetical protein